MKKAPIPEDEAERQAALDAYGVLDTPVEDAYDDFTLLSSQICGTPIWKTGSPTTSITGCASAGAVIPRDKIFEPFGQAGGEIATEYGGAGLGLTIRQTLARALGGGIKLESETGVGSTFTLTFSADPAPAAGGRRGERLN